MRGVFPTVAAIVFSLSLSATAATVDEEPVPFPALPDPSESQGKGPPTQKGAPTLSPEERARSAKALVDRNGNGLSDGLEDRLATLGPDEPVDVIVTFSGPGDSASARAAVGNFSVKHEYSLIPGFAATMRAAQAQALAAAPGVFRAEEDVRVQAFLESARPDYGVEDLVAEFGLDPFAGGLTGDGVTICFVDSGIQGDHEAFNVHNPDGTIFSTKIDGFMDFIGSQIDPYDDFGHGTHVAGIAASDGEPGPVAFGAKHTPAHRWYYYPKMTREEALLIKQWDSAGTLARSDGALSDGSASSAPCTFSFHSAFEDPASPLDAPDRWSIEVRCMVIYD